MFCWHVVGGGIALGDVLLHRLELLRSRGFPDSAKGVLRRNGKEMV